jgi:hypothetical protein
MSVCCSVAAALQRCSVAVLQCCSAAVLQCCSVAVLQCCSAAVQWSATEAAAVLAPHSKQCCRPAGMCDMRLMEVFTPASLGSDPHRTPSADTTLPPDSAAVQCGQGEAGLGWRVFTGDSSRDSILLWQLPAAGANP